MLLLSCWQDKPEERPTFTEILQELEHFLECIAEYFVISGLRTVDDNESCEQAYFRASPTERNRGASLQPHIVALPNDYCIAAET